MVVLLPVSNFAVLDREAGTVASVNTSRRGLAQARADRRNPKVALAFHTREFAATDRPEYVLVQGTASLRGPVEDYPSTILDVWERFEPWADQHPLWKRWRRVYALRTAIEVSVERVLVWPDLGCRGPVEVQGSPLPPDPPAPQSEPRNGTAPRINHGRAAERASGLPHALLGWVGADGFPLTVPVEVAGSDERGILLNAPEGIVPPGGRRAGLTAHWFSRSVIGQNQRKHTGWLDAGNSSSTPRTRSPTTASPRSSPCSISSPADSPALD